MFLDAFTPKSQNSVTFSILGAKDPDLFTPFRSWKQTFVGKKLFWLLSAHSKIS